MEVDALSDLALEYVARIKVAISHRKDQHEPATREQIRAVIIAMNSIFDSIDIPKKPVKERSELRKKIVAFLTGNPLIKDGDYTTNALNKAQAGVLLEYILSHRGTTARVYPEYAGILKDRTISGSFNLLNTTWASNYLSYLRGNHKGK